MREDRWAHQPQIIGRLVFRVLSKNDDRWQWHIYPNDEHGIVNTETLTRVCVGLTMKTLRETNGVESEMGQKHTFVVHDAKQRGIDPRMLITYNSFSGNNFSSLAPGVVDGDPYCSVAVRTMGGGQPCCQNTFWKYREELLEQLAV